MSQVDWLQRVLLFQSLSPEQLATLIGIAQPQNFAKGAVVFKQGNAPTGFFIVKTGRVKVYQASLNGKEQILRIFKAGESFAEATTFDGQPLPASAATLEPTELIFFPRLPFLDLLHRHPDLAIHMLASLSQHLRHLTEVIEDLSFRDVPQRLAAYLLHLSETQANPGGGRSAASSVVTLDLTKSQLAAALGTIPATLSRAFYRLSNDGLIAVNGSEVELLDCDRLKRLTQISTSENS